MTTGAGPTTTLGDAPAMPASLFLADPRDERLERSPLRLVVCQVRHDSVAAVADAGRALAVHEKIRADFPSIEQIHDQTAFSVELGSRGISSANVDPMHGWQFRSGDGSWTVTLTRSFFSLETSAYDRWSAFRDNLERLVRAVDAVIGPSIEQRLGLRMVDQVLHPDGPSSSDFRGLIVDELLGPLSGGLFLEAVRSTQALVEIQGPDSTTVNLRHGLQDLDGAPSYLLDHDCFRQEGARFDPDGILVMVDQLHRMAKQVFEASVSDRLYDYLRG